MNVEFDKKKCKCYLMDYNKDLNASLNRVKKIKDLENKIMEL